MDLKNLSEPFAPEDIEWRIQSAWEKNSKLGALVVPYIDNRAIMNRLDEVCGPENWRNEFVVLPDGILCGISIRVHTGRQSDGAPELEWITKWDGASRQGQEEDTKFKGGLSGSMKRAGVLWGIGRYLYSLEAGFAAIGQPNRTRYRTNTKVKVAGSNERKYATIHWDPPELPSWALSAGASPKPAAPRNAPEEVPPANPEDAPPTETPKENSTPKDSMADAMKRADAIEWLRVAYPSADPQRLLVAYCERVMRKDFNTIFGGALTSLLRKLEDGSVTKWADQVRAEAAANGGK